MPPLSILLYCIYLLRFSFHCFLIIYMCTLQNWNLFCSWGPEGYKSMAIFTSTCQNILCPFRTGPREWRAGDFFLAIASLCIWTNDVSGSIEPHCCPVDYLSQSPVCWSDRSHPHSGQPRVGRTSSPYDFVSYNKSIRLNPRRREHSQSTFHIS